MPEQEKAAIKPKQAYVSHDTAAPARAFVKEVGAHTRIGGEAGQLILSALVRDNPLELVALAEAFDARKKEGCQFDEGWLAETARAIKRDTPQKPPRPSKEEVASVAVDDPRYPPWYGLRYREACSLWWSPIWDYTFTDEEQAERAPVRAFWARLQREHEERQKAAELGLAAAEEPKYPPWFGHAERSTSPAWHDPLRDHLFADVAPDLRAPVEAWWAQLRRRYEERQRAEKELERAESERQAD